MLHIFTLNWNGADKLQTLYNSLIPALKDIDYVWHIKDNGSKDNSVELIKRWNNNNIKCYEYPDNNQNFAAGMNYCFSKAEPNDNDFILLLNNDIIFNDMYSIKNMMHIFNKEKNVGVVGARLLFTDTNKLQHAGVVFGKYKGLPLHFRAQQNSDKNALQNREFQCVTGAVLLTKAEYYRNIFKNTNGINGMDENYQWCFEDIDLCLSIKYNMNKKIIYCGKTNIFHEESATLKKSPTNKLFMPHNVKYFTSKWLGKYKIDQQLYDNKPKLNILK